MLQKESRRQSKVFRNFRTLDTHNYHSIVYFYERHKKDMFDLSFDEAFTMLLHYCNALFEIGRYERQIQIADEIIQRSILNNIQFYEGEDIYIKTLFQKSKSHFHLEDYSTAEHILKELIKMSPFQMTFSKWLKKCIAEKQSRWVDYLEVSGVLLFIFSVISLLLNVLIIKHFYNEYTLYIYQFCIITLGLSGSFYFLGIVFHRFQVNRAVKKIQLEAVNKKKKIQ